MPSFAQMMTNLPLHMGGLGLRSAVRFYPTASWASGAMVQERHPEVATILVDNLTHHTVATSISSVQQCQRRLVGAGFELPTWDRLVEGQRPSASDDDEGSWGGWQQKASEKLERDHFSTLRTLTESEQAMVPRHGLRCFPGSRGHHRSACATTGVLDVKVSQLRAQWPAFAVKAEVVSGPTFSSGTSIWVLNHLDGKRIEDRS